MKFFLLYSFFSLVLINSFSCAWGMDPEEETEKTVSGTFIEQWAKTIDNFHNSQKQKFNSNITGLSILDTLKSPSFRIKRDFLKELSKIHAPQQGATKNDLETGIPIPKNIHYIWVGGSIYQEYWNGITRTAHIASPEGYTVNLWVDDPNNLRYVKEKIDPTNSIRSINDEEYNLYVNKLKTIKVRHIDELRSLN